MRPAQRGETFSFVQPVIMLFISILEYKQAPQPVPWAPTMETNFHNTNLAEPTLARTEHTQPGIKITPS